MSEHKILFDQVAELGICSFAQNRSFKRATISNSLTLLVSESLSSRFKIERCEWFPRDSSKLLAKNEQIAQNVFFVYVFDNFPPFYAQEQIDSVALCSFTLFKERLEQFAPISLYKRVTMSHLLRSLMTKEQRERFALFHEQITFLLTKKRVNRSKNQWANSQPCQVECLQKLSWKLSLSSINLRIYAVWPIMLHYYGQPIWIIYRYMDIYSTFM